MKKRKLFVVYIAILICFEGCKFGGDSTGDNVTEKASNSMITEEKSTSLIEEEKNTDVMSEETGCIPRKDKYSKDFWKDGNTFLVKIMYVMDGEETFFKSKGCAKIHKERDYNNGTIYHVIVSSDDGNIKNRSMAYFYVEDEKIYVIYNYDNNSKNIDNNNLQLVFQQESMEEDDEKGLHYSIENEGKIMKFSLYTYNVDTNYFHQMEWGKDRNIKLYKTGYGGGRDLFKVEFIEKIF